MVRTFFDATFSWTDDSYTNSGTTPGTTVYSQIGALGTGQANNGTSGAYYTQLDFDHPSVSSLGLRTPRNSGDAEALPLKARAKAFFFTAASIVWREA